MFSFISDLFNYNKKELNRISKILSKINELEENAKSLKNSDFSKETEKLKHKISQGENLDQTLPWVYSLVREASFRTLKQRHFDVQMIAAIGLHEGKIVEQKTGEGKTLTATAALYLNALKNQGVHLVTVNDYLARRDAGWMGQIFHLLGMSTSAIITGQSYIYDPDYSDSEAQDPRLVHLKPISRKIAYDADITYGINSEFGFDYLRDNMATATSELVQRGFNFAIVDEADSVLIDEARTPHIISAPYDEDTSKYYDYAKIVKQLDKKKDYIIDEKLKTAHVTEEGILKIEKVLGIENIYEKDFDSIFHIEAALKAHTLFHLDKDYILRNDEVIIVDEFTGRLLEGRRFSEGLHQAIEAKERVTIKRESKTLATVSLQNYFRMYKKLAGMTGTAATEAQEFSKIYNTDVLVIPTNKKNARADHPDMIYKTESGKFKAVAEDIANQYKIGRPVLVGTTSIEKNEHLSRLLTQKGIPHELLNAKNHEREARIIKQAGKKFAVTVATNMAGRGVDIVLGGDISVNPSSKTDADKTKNQWQKEHDEVVALGGLYVVGTERHEARRIDNQLRGRSGRQGDSGETRFFVSLEDDVMRIFGGEQISNMMTFLKFPEDQPLSHSLVSRAIEQAQVKVEGFNFDIRKNLVEYDDVLNKQRDIVYTLRRKILLLPEKDAKSFKNTVFKVVEEEIASLTSSYYALNNSNETYQNQFESDLKLLFDVEKDILDKKLKENETSLSTYLLNEAENAYKEKEKIVGSELWNKVVQSVFLSTIDQFWTQHLTAIDDLRQGINLRGYAQLDPLVEYKNEAFSLFEKLLSAINYESVRRVMRLQIQEKEPIKSTVEGRTSESRHFHFHAAANINPYTQVKQLNQNTQSANVTKNKTAPNTPSTAPSIKKLGRNEPCWCGSGKKYKKCHYPN